ncbi:MAG: hypothetical protein MI673_00615 [Thiotrichales bacterium]|nr:hypothetical protein [Thiotrichales bacterium]
MKNTRHNIVVILFSVFILCIHPAWAVSDSELEALEKQILQKEAEVERQQQMQREAEAEARRKAERERRRVTEEERQRKEQQAELERLRLLEAQQRIEEEKLKAEQERLRREEETRRQAEQEQNELYEKLHEVAENYLEDEQYEKAIREYTNILERNPGDKRAEGGIETARKFQDTCNSIIGKWQVAPHNIFWDVFDNHTVYGEWLIFSANGIWECQSARQRTFVISWPECGVCLTETLQLSEDGNTLKGTHPASLTTARRFGTGQPDKKSEQPTAPRL